MSVKVPFAVVDEELANGAVPHLAHLRALDAWRECGVWVTDRPLSELLRAVPCDRAKLWSDAAKSLPVRRDSAAAIAARASTPAELEAIANKLRVVCLPERRAAAMVVESARPEVTSLRGLPDCECMRAAREKRERLILEGTSLGDVWTDWFDVAAALPGPVVVADPYAFIDGARGKKGFDRFVELLVRSRGRSAAVELSLLSSIHSEDPRVSDECQRAWARELPAAVRRHYPGVSVRTFDVPKRRMVHFRFIRLDRVVFKLDKGLVLFNDTRTTAAYDVSTQGLGNYLYFEKTLMDAGRKP